MAGGLAEGDAFLVEEVDELGDEVAVGDVGAEGAPGIEEELDLPLPPGGVYLFDAGVGLAGLEEHTIFDPVFVQETQQQLRGVLSGADQGKERVFAYVMEHV